jgi:hypothetical protein
MGHGFDSQQEQDFSLLQSVQTGSWAHLTSYAVGTGAISPGVKRLGLEADHSTPYSAEAKKCGLVPPFPYVFIA